VPVQPYGRFTARLAEIAIGLLPERVVVLPGHAGEVRGADLRLHLLLGHGGVDAQGGDEKDVARGDSRSIEFIEEEVEEAVGRRGAGVVVHDKDDLAAPRADLRQAGAAEGQPQGAHHPLPLVRRLPFRGRR